MAPFEVRRARAGIPLGCMQMIWLAAQALCGLVATGQRR